MKYFNYICVNIVHSKWIQRDIRTSFRSKPGPGTGNPENIPVGSQLKYYFTRVVFFGIQQGISKLEFDSHNLTIYTNLTIGTTNSLDIQGKSLSVR